VNDKHPVDDLLAGLLAVMDGPRRLYSRGCAVACLLVSLLLVWFVRCFLLGESLIRGVASRGRESGFNSTRRRYKGLSVIDSILVRRSREYRGLVLLAALMFLALPCALRPFADLLSHVPLFFGGMLIVVLSLHYLTFLYRVRTGLYGTNVREAREILRFIAGSAAGGGDAGGRPKRVGFERNLGRAREQDARGLLGAGDEHA
jgi:hypothetical protein